MLKKYIKTLAMALIMALVFTMFVPVEKTEASSGVTQSAIYSDRIELNLNLNSYLGSNYRCKSCK